MIANHAALIESLETAAVAPGDFYAAAFERYFSLCPESSELLAHSDELMRGRMMEQVISLFLDPDVEALETYFRFEVANHEAYGARPAMYGHLFRACREVARERCGSNWGSEAEEAWEAQGELLLGLIGRYSEEPG